jgi:hypothetical protein
MSKFYKNNFKPRVNAPIIDNKKFNSLSFGEKTPCQYSNGSKNVTYIIKNYISNIYNNISDYSKVYVKEDYYILDSSKFALHLGLTTLKHE